MIADNKINIYKPYLKGTPAYVGGKSKNEIISPAENIYKLSSNENALGSSPKAIAAIQDHLNYLYEYPDRTDARLRHALADHFDHKLSEGHFMATPSGSEMIDLIVRAFLSEGLECIASSPCFQPYFMFSGNHGATVVDVPLIGDKYSLDVDGILAAINERTRLVFVTSPNNPTGGYVPRNEMDYLVNNLPEHVILVFDEVYRHFVDAEDYTSALPYIVDGKQVIAVNSFSKSHGLAGMRMGYAYGPENVIKYIRQLWKPFLMNTLAIEAMIAALSDDDFIAKTRNLILSEKEYLYKELDKLGITYWKSQGNFIMIQPPIAEAEFEEHMLIHGIMVRPITSFGAKQCIRVTIGTTAANRAYIKGLQALMNNISVNKFSN